MKKYVLPLLLLIAITTQKLGAQGILHTQGEKIVNDRGENVLFRGIGLGGYMLQEGYMLHLGKDGQQHKIRERIARLLTPAQTQEFYDTWLAHHTTKADIDSLKAWGFNQVRLPMHFNLYTLPADKEPVPGQQTWLDKGFTMTDSLVAWCKAAGIYLILDLHAAPGGQGNDLNISDRDGDKPSLWQQVADQDKTVALWKKLATRYAHEATIAGYDLLNEPNWGFDNQEKDPNGIGEKTNGPLKALLVRITEAIRSVDKEHIIIIEGNAWGNNYNGMLNDGLWDKNMVLSFHKYWNNNDTASIGHMLRYRQRLQVPIWLGETGENSNTWFTDAITLFESNNIGWSWWPLKKLGINNPLQIPSNKGYDALVDYWNGKRSTPPDADSAYHALLELANATDIRHNIVHRDVIDAMIRQPHSLEAIAFKANIAAPGTTIAAADYDLGRNGVAYFDKDSGNYRISTGHASVGNRGGVYRNDGVDIYNDTAHTNAYYVGHTEDGEWLQYNITVTDTRNYALQTLVRGEGQFQWTENGKALTPPQSSPAGTAWQAVSTTKVHLVKGRHQLRLQVLKGGFDFAALKF
ncbi:Carbohydrate binding module (family 6) [Chitinophaga costaii]|uniref:Carbohydrate binding module (Family 6) n=1 Tax=Chitinophaga costaii TaxID=1335309 RepID=A0A1C4CMN5_9BACT|nr:cellulase family glycosylhydrolase [Chitinophaga costaii]PUZ27295.1 glycosyl hydrolase family 5 [Chitinophaga costaii]SCC20366.1 Carbohydrate binding module (family 6) [Chitinophaga costaii]